MISFQVWELELIVDALNDSATLRCEKFHREASLALRDRIRAEISAAKCSGCGLLLTDAVQVAAGDRRYHVACAEAIIQSLRARKRGARG